MVSGTVAHALVEGPVPLTVPVILAALATLGAWRRKTLMLLMSTAAMLFFCFVTGFSIGAGYVPAGVAVLAALLVRLVSNAAQPSIA